jgi:hypothetical protein
MGLQQQLRSRLVLSVDGSGSSRLDQLDAEGCVRVWHLFCVPIPLVLSLPTLMSECASCLASKAPRNTDHLLLATASLP